LNRFGRRAGEETDSENLAVFGVGRHQAFLVI
jgi:hypothetical protein